MGRLRELYSGYFAVVMATGIISTAAARYGEQGLSAVLLVLAGAAYLAMVGAYLARLSRWPRAVLADVRSPERSFGFFTFVAATMVLAERLDEERVTALALALAVAGALAWLVLTYALPAAVMLAEEKRELADTVNGSWLLWVVATQSLATAAAMVAVHERSLSRAMAILAVATWSVGVALYLVLIVLLMIRLLVVRLSPKQLGPPYWINMGATAITVLAGARIVGLGHAWPVLELMVPLVGGLSFVLWAFGTWWIPLLLVFGVWRHAVRRESLAYDPAYWSVVFPLGMYAASSGEFAGAEAMPWMYEVGRYEMWVALLAWALVIIAWGLSVLPPRAAVPAVRPEY